MVWTCSSKWGKENFMQNFGNECCLRHGEDNGDGRYLKRILGWVALVQVHSQIEDFGNNRVEHSHFSATFSF